MGLLDSIASWFKPAKASPTKPQGGPNIANYAGWVYGNEQHPDLTGAAKWETYRAMLRSAEVGHAVRKRQALGARPKWTAQACEDGQPSTNAEAQRFADLVDTVLRRMRTPLPQVVERLMLYDVLGFAVSTWTAEKWDDGTLGIREIRPIAQETIEKWAQDETGQVLGCVQRSPQTQAELPIDRSRMVYLVDNALDDHPEGMGLLRQAAEAYRLIRAYYQYEGIGFQTNLAGMPKLWAPLQDMLEELTDPQKDNLTPDQAQAVIAAKIAPHRTFAENHLISSKRAVMLDSEPFRDIQGNPTGGKKWDVELVTNPGGPQAEIAAAMQTLRFVIARLFGVDGDLLGSESTGTYALAKEKSTHLMLVVDSVLGNIAAALERDILGPLWLINGWPEEWKPKLCPEPLSKNVELMTATIEGLARAGATVQVTDPAIDVVRQAAGLPPQPEVDPVAEGMLSRLTSTEDESDGSVDVEFDDDQPEVPEDGEGGEQDKPEENVEPEKRRKRRRKGGRR